MLFALMFTFPMQAVAEKKLTVYTVNYPLSYFTERIGSDHVNVVFPAPAHIDPAFWIPSAATVRKYQQADLIILNGAGYAKWTKKVSLPMLRSVDSSRSFRDSFIKISTTATHNHGPGGDHSHSDTAFTTWLDFSQAAQQAEAVYKALLRKDPAHKTDFTYNFQSLKKDLLTLDDRVTALSVKKKNMPLFGSHPIYQYLARRYKLNLEMVMWEPDADPGEAQWKHLLNLAIDHPARWMLWEGEPLLASTKRLQDMHIQRMIFSPCFSRPDQGDFLSVMKQNIKNMEIIFRLP